MEESKKSWLNSVRKTLEMSAFPRFLLPTNAHADLVSRISVAKFKNMRHLNKKIQDTFVKYVEEVSKIEGKEQ